MTLLSIENLGISFGGLKAVDNVSFQVKQVKLHPSLAPTVPVKRPCSI